MIESQDKIANENDGEIIKLAYTPEQEIKEKNVEIHIRLN